MHRVFVYGTLKRGDVNHHWLEGARPLGRRRLAGLQLHDLGPYPMAVPAGSSLIHGELYAVEAGGLARLDELEDVPREYVRELLPLSDGSRAWVYRGRADQVQGRPLVPFADWGTTPIFSYGSNLCPEQLAGRCPAWDGSGLVVRLDGWRWGIRKIRVGRGRGEGAAGIRPDPQAHCWGVVHHLPAADRRELDRREGVSIGHYRHQSVQVTSLSGERFPVSTYVPTPEWSAEGLIPGEEYAARILRGAAHWQLPEGWRQQLEAELARPFRSLPLRSGWRAPGAPSGPAPGGRPPR